ncbi:hypothetical protein A33Q_3735 [Indibacter alkaliphilus LW1]|uniref:TonB-dependent outer membrane receptor, SusC/RagA subfamily, signature region n=2 Tax=Indibacter TaxID=647744 RepID=S2DNF1_INDAL|nr:hypothetical protein A33Q_3735 [Indibacter alkaliphilus LW1]
MGSAQQFIIDRILNQLLYTMKKLLTICLMLVISQGHAQDIFQESLYSAELVMKNRDKISLTDQQAEKIKNIHSQNAGEFSSLKWDLDNANAKLKTMLAAKKVDQAAVEKQMDLVLSLENQLKRKQFSTLVAIKNELTESQQTELNQVKGSVTRLRGVTGVQGLNGYSFGDGKKGVVSVTTSGVAQPIYIIKQDGKKKKVFSVSDIDPNSIESMQVLKGTTAVDEYGDEGKNGVIIMTLKKGTDYNFEE